MPRDERRECLRALHRCRLKKVVLIGKSCPVGNTWGFRGEEVTDIVISRTRQNNETLESEDINSIWSLGASKPSLIESDFKFEPSYGWPAQAPMLHTIATFHPDITELKICGVMGCLVLNCPTTITFPMYAPLKYLHRLQSLTSSVWLSTIYEETWCDREIIKYWLASRDASSKALVTVTDDPLQGWALELEKTYSPKSLASRVTGFFGPLLSEKAKAQRNGVKVRVSLEVGENGGVFDLDVRIGKGPDNRSVCLGYEGPREEQEPKRRKAKLDDRRWF